jgi:putative membrane protein
LKKIIENLKVHRNTLLIAVLILFYTVGSVGTLSDTYRTHFLALSPYNLILSFAVAVLAIESKNNAQIFFFLICYLFSMSSEWIGTSTGYLFGTYDYGKNLGVTLYGVPLVIGLNWWILLMGVSSIGCYLRLNYPVSVIFGALLMTLVDLLIEPVAMKSDFWHWENGEIPFYNFVCWFVIAFILLLIKQKISKQEPNKVHAVLFVVIALFFSIQNLI